MCRLAEIKIQTDRRVVIVNKFTDRVTSHRLNSAQMANPTTSEDIAAKQGCDALAVLAENDIAVANTNYVNDVAAINVKYDFLKRTRESYDIKQEARKADSLEKIAAARKKKRLSDSSEKRTLQQLATKAIVVDSVEHSGSAEAVVGSVVVAAVAGAVVGSSLIAAASLAEVSSSSSSSADLQIFDDFMAN